MQHVDDYLKTTHANPIAREFLEQARRPSFLAVNTHVTALSVDQTDIDIALEMAKRIEDGGEPTAADCIRACARAAQATLGNPRKAAADEPRP